MQRIKEKYMLEQFLKNKPLMVFLLSIMLFTVFKSGNLFLPIEELALPSAIGYDLISDDNDIKYSISIPVYYYQSGGEVITETLTGTDRILPQTRQIRQLKSNRKLLLGLERVVVYSEDYARYGIRTSLDILFSTITINDTAYIAVSNCKAADILSHKVPGYPSSGDYMEGLIEHSTDFNFSPINYKLIDAYARVDAEGRNFTAPYVEIKGDFVQITGMALFKGDRMIAKVNNDDAKIINLLRDNKVRGIISLEKSPKEYISYYGTSKRKVKCEKSGDKYIFTIDLSLKGDILSNTIDKSIFNNPEDLKNFQNKMSKQIEKQCDEIIRKIQEDYRVDCLELGWFAASKFGRNTGTDWNEVVTNSQIKVNVKISVGNTGRGNY